LNFVLCAEGLSMDVGVDARSLGPMKTGVGIYLSQVLRHWPASHSPDRFQLFSHRVPSLPETAAVCHDVAARRWGLPWYLFESHRRISGRQLTLFWGAQGLLPLQLPKALPAVVTIHDCIHQQGVRFAPSLLYNWAHRWMLPVAVRRADKVLAVSRFVADEAMRHLGVQAAKIEVTQLGVSAEFFADSGEAINGSAVVRHQPEGPNRHSLNVLGKHRIGEFFILGVGTLEPRKNLKTLLRAYTRLPSRLQSKFQLVLAGKPGWGTAELRRYLDIHPQRSQFVLTGYVDDEDLRALYASASMFVFPSFYEGFGLPVLEALASGCPVIASSAAALKEVAGPAAIFVDPNASPEVWSQAIARVAESDDLKRSLATAGPARARCFSWETCARQTAGVFSDAAGGRA